VMDFDAEDEGNTNAMENMEVRSDSRPPHTPCRCGAYDKIMVATSILRNRIIDAVNNELDQYEQPLSCLLQFSKGSAYCENDVASASSQLTFEESKNSPPLSSQSQSRSSELSTERSPSLDLIVNDIVVNASLLLLSKLK
ncbi:hypothetical protein V3C99_003596, partial [Haemonchus contortus]